MHNHHTYIDRKTLEENTKVIEKANNRHSLAIKEAIIIQTNNPIINKQFSKFDNVLKLQHSKPYSSSIQPNYRTIRQTDEGTTAAISSQPNNQDSSSQHSDNNDNQPNDQGETTLPINGTDDININQNTSPNIQARIHNLLRQVRTPAVTPTLVRRLRPRTRPIEGLSLSLPEDSEPATPPTVSPIDI